MFAQVAEARSDETFVALCLLTVTGASLLTQKLGFSDTMGAFVAGVLLAETNYSTQVLRPSPPRRPCMRTCQLVLPKRTRQSRTCILICTAIPTIGTALHAVRLFQFHAWHG